MNKEIYKRNIKSEEEQSQKSQKLGLDFGDTLEKLKGEYLDEYKGIQSEILSITRFDENSDLSTTYLGRVDVIKDSKIKEEESFPISEQGYTMGKLLDLTECQVLLDTGASKSFMCMDVSHSACKYARRLFFSKTELI